MSNNMWWGYIHTNGSIQPKVYLSAIDLVEADASPFVDLVFGPFLANNREEAIEIIRDLRTCS